MKKLAVLFLVLCILMSSLSAGGNVQAQGAELTDNEGVTATEFLPLSSEEQELNAEPRESELQLLSATEGDSYPAIWITELVPHPLPDYRRPSGNQYEYLEVFNNSDQVLNLKDYTIWYLYPNSTAPKSWKVNVDTAIAPYSTGVVWFAKEAFTAGYTTVNDFNTHYNTTLSDTDVVIFNNSLSEHFNIPNNLERGYAIATPDEPSVYVAEAWLDAKAGGAHSIIADVRNSSVYYAPVAGSPVMSSLGTRPYGNPGILDAEQLPIELQQDVLAPVLTHSQDVTSIEISNSKSIQVESNEELSEATLWYWNTADDGTPAGQVELQQEVSEAGYVYSGELTLQEAGSYRYIIEGVDGAGHASRLPVNSRGYNVTVVEPVDGGEEPGATEPNGAPSILITELVPHPLQDYRTGGGNQYEFLELYNNSSEVLNLKDYTLWYLYPNSTAPKKWIIPYETAIEPYSAAVIWFAKEAVTAGYTTTEDFNTHYHTSLSDADIIFYDNKNSADFNLPNVTHRGLGISSGAQPDKLIVEAWYNSNANGADKLAGEVRNTAITFTYPTEGIVMTSRGTRVFSTPGSIDAGQVPAVDGVDMVAPTLEHNQTAYNIKQNDTYKLVVKSDEELDIAASEVIIASRADNSGSQTVLLSQISGSGDEYIYGADIVIPTTGVYSYKIHAVDLNGNTTKLPYNSRGALLTVNEGGRDPVLPEVGLSLEDGAFVRNGLAFYAYGDQASSTMNVYFDEQLQNSSPALPGSVQFGLQSEGIDQIYQTSLSAIDAQGNKQYFARLLPKYVNDAWTLEELPASFFVGNSSISVHAGNENAPYDLDIHDAVYGMNNHDDYTIKNLHLVLPDGTLVKPTHMTNYAGAKTVTDAPYVENMFFAMGDGNAQKALISTFHFPIPEEKYTARYVYVDTTSYDDGQYIITYVLNGNEVSSIEVVVDNTPPSIDAIMLNEETELVTGMEIKGHVAIDVAASDVGSDIASVEAKLDGASIALPYETSSVVLSPGAHTLDVLVIDGAGNEAFKSYTFHVADERPLEPANVSPVDGAEQVSLNATLSATVEDETGDAMKVEFYKGHQYDAASKEVQVYRHVADREPPLVIAPEGEQQLQEDELALISKEDGQYLYQDSTSGFPYHRFEVEVGEISSDAVVELYWKGRTLPNRIVTMYAWDVVEQKWIGLTAQTGISAEEDIVLLAEVEQASFVENGKIQVMIQDEVKGVNDPFRLLWFTDTQYYAESYNDIFDTLGDWIVDEYEQGNFSYAIHTGDIVNRANVIEQWEVADRNLKKLDDANVPYGVLAGNHDVIIEGVDYSYYHQYVGADRYEDNPWYGGQMNNNQNHYDLISIGGHDFIVLYIGFGLETTPETISWANEALKKHADRNAIVGLHAYLESNGTLSNMAQQVYDEVIAPNKNVMMVLSGHYHAAKTVIKEVQHEDGTTRQVIEMLADYQGGPNGGDGYVRLLNFDPEAGMLEVQTYSPVLDDYNFFEEENVDSFTQPIELIDINKRVATDYFAVNVYQDSLIGAVDQVESGEKVSVTWKSLSPKTKYYWYMVVEDEYGAVRRSQIHHFTTRAASGSTEEPSSPSEPEVPTEPTNPTKPETPEGYTTIPSQLKDGYPVLEVSSEQVGPIYTTYTAEGGIHELQLVVWHVDEQGNRSVVPNGRYDAVLGGMVFSAEQAGHYIVTYEPVMFNDVASGAWYSDAVSYMAARGVVQGVGKGQFAPQADVKRADFVIMLMNTLGIAVKDNSTSNFADANPQAYYSRHLATAKELGIVLGSGSNLFKPEDSISRQDMIVMLDRALKAVGKPIFAQDGATLDQYNDADDLADYAVDAVRALVAAGIIKGSNGQLNGQETTTRGMVIEMLYQYLLKQ